MTAAFLIVMVAVLQSRTAVCCPGGCACESTKSGAFHGDDGFYEVRCDGVANGTILLPQKTKELVVTGMGRNDVDVFLIDLMGNLERFPYLSTLIFVGNDVPVFLNVSLSGTDSLKSLAFSQNRIGKIEDGDALNFTSLETLDLSRNKLEVINSAAFRTMGHLQLLNLSYNSLVNVSSDAFEGLDSLTYLDLSVNNLTYIGGEVLSPLNNILFLNLSRNQLEVLDDACFNSLLRLQQLDVSWNKLARVSPGSLHLPSLVRLLLEGNPMLGGSRELPLLMGTGRRLQTVDASRTGLKQVPSALTHSIRTLHLAGNSIRSVNRGDLDCYPLLQLLDITSNLLQEIEEDAIGRLDSLTVLYLSGNKISTVPKSLPERLRVLHLENNEVERIKNGDFSGLGLLEVLLLHDNKITVVEESAFGQLESLATLDLSRNPISKLDVGCLSGPGQLQVLRLSGLPEISSPAEDVMFPLSAPEHLITLDLSNSPGLARQFLEDDAALAASRELQELNIARTGLEYIRSDLMHFLSQLRLLHVNDNPLNCTSMHWLALWMRRQDEPEYREVICTNPPELWGTLLIDLQQQDYCEGCEEKTPREKNTNLTQTPTNEVSADPFRNATPAEQNTATATSISLTETMEILNEVYIPSIESTNEYEKNATTEMVDFEIATTHEYDINSTASNNETISNQIITDAVTSTMETVSGENNDEQTENVPTSAATGEMSMYSLNEQRGKESYKILHPGMLILALGILGTAASLVMLTSRFTRRKKRHQNHHHQEDTIEVSSITELW